MVVSYRYPSSVDVARPPDFLFFSFVSLAPCLLVRGVIFIMVLAFILALAVCFLLFLSSFALKDERTGLLSYSGWAVFQAFHGVDGGAGLSSLMWPPANHFTMF